MQRWIRNRQWLAGPAALALCLLSLPSAVPAQTGTRAVSFRENANKTGAVTGTGVRPPLRERWSRSFDETTSFPVIADGKVFLTVADGDNYGTDLYALDRATGATVWGPVNLGGTYFWSSLCYDRGVVITLDFDGTMRAFEGTTGAPRWSLHLGSEYFVTAAPTVYDGVVYAVGNYEVWALDTQTGTVRWHVGGGGGDTSPVVTDEGVYVLYACSVTYKFRRSDGALLWTTYYGCSGGGGDVPVLYGNKLYVRGYPSAAGDRILDPATGATIGTHPSGLTPAFADGRGFFVRYDRVLEAINAGSGASLWTFSGDGQISTEPLVVDGFVYVGSTTGMLWALDPSSGAVVWSTNLGSAVLGEGGCCTAPWSGMSAWDGLLVVPTADRVVALETVAGPTFDFVVQDDRTGDYVAFNSTTGEYEAWQCAKGSALRGRGVVTKQGTCTVSLTTRGAATVSATAQRCRNQGTAAARGTSPDVNFRSTDTNLSNSHAACSGQ